MTAPALTALRRRVLAARKGAQTRRRMAEARTEYLLSRVCRGKVSVPSVTDKILDEPRIGYGREFGIRAVPAFLHAVAA